MRCMRVLRSHILARGSGIPPFAARAHVYACQGVVAWTDTVIYDVHCIGPSCSYHGLSRPQVPSSLSCAIELRLQVIIRSTEWLVRQHREGAVVHLRGRSSERCRVASSWQGRKCGKCRRRLLRFRFRLVDAKWCRSLVQAANSASIE